MTVSVPAQAPIVHYIYIPADVNENIQELELNVPPGREVECLLDTLKEHFKRTGGKKTAAQQQAHRQHLVDQVGTEAAAKLSDEMLAAALDMQIVETVALQINNPESGYVGVNLYCDDQAVFKELPYNSRASQIADCCGRPTQVRGDAFLGRLFDNDDSFVRLSLRLSEVSSSAAWVRAAGAQAASRMRRGDRAADFLAAMKQQQQQRQQQSKPPTATVRELTPAEVEKDAGNAAVKAGDWAEAVARYTAALDLDPGLVAAANNRSLALLRLGRCEEAEADCCKVLEVEPNNVKALLRRATARSAAGRPTEAVGDLQAVLALEPHNKEAAKELAKLAPPPPPPPPPASAAEEEEGTATAAAGADEAMDGSSAPQETTAVDAYDHGVTSGAIAAAPTSAGAAAAAGGVAAPASESA
ncbi:hypothetical protein VOLCADRAFT_121451 [Volvox carteri f. nagariensis]|uniref:Uncharacterized protein n=1 Tax=Volvox carteri f. nagariensis TaxID=3068 RepID=D8UAM5_VOLCA|nr:uncharacterized protein VOLCADRAFT_121451 [Volvox carteri f. nagariensis]EFJ43133.1 hypothetical protein VOLCADRAFT_121451 [Volvox carteri f. nagariensis]|eukprot:XP_002955708.1 hypothetical protein VOLCADRAFT_121451 [Volvox carteri f. nagariensis]